MEQAGRERLIVDMVECGRAWEEDTSRPDFSLSVVQRLATLEPGEYEAVWAEFKIREVEEMEAGMEVEDDDLSDIIAVPGEMFHYTFQGDTQIEEARRLAAEFVENARSGVGTLQLHPASISHTLTTETEALLGRLLNPTTTLECLCVAAMRGDAVAFAALSDGIQQGELTL